MNNKIARGCILVYDIRVIRPIQRLEVPTVLFTGLTYTQQAHTANESEGARTLRVQRENADLERKRLFDVIIAIMKYELTNLERDYRNATLTNPTLLPLEFLKGKTITIDLQDHLVKTYLEKVASLGSRRDPFMAFQNALQSVFGEDADLGCRGFPRVGSEFIYVFEITRIVQVSIG